MRGLFRLLAGVVIFSASPAQSAPSEQQRAVETGLTPAVVFEGREQTRTIEESLRRFATPGVSVAVIEGGRIVWAQGYGTLSNESRAPVTPETRFQAASISKPVAAAAAMRLAQDGRLSLDADINTILKTWRLPPSPFTEGAPVTLRHLLSHTGGTTVHGFPGYAPDAAVPTNAQLLAGQPPANTGAVVSEARPGERRKYSGGGYQIVQQMIEDATGEAFAAVVRRWVLSPAGMIHSGYDRPPIGAFAQGFAASGETVTGGAHIYPEQAAAGLWTTPTDLARFALAIGAALRDEPDAMLSADTARLMITPVMGGYGLGPGVEGEGEALQVSHGGANEGYRAWWIYYPATGQGLAVMSNSDTGDRVNMEIARAVARAYGWPGFTQRTARLHRLDDAVLKAREGTWVTSWDGERLAFNARRTGDGLTIDTPRGAYEVLPTAADTMLAPDTGATVTFTTRPDGKPVMKAFGLELVKE